MSALLSSREFRNLVSGERKGLFACLLRTGLALAEVPYTMAVRARNRRYDRNRIEIKSVDVPVICVGNLTMGGTGKTPMVHYIAKWFRSNDRRVALVSRGYGAVGGQQNDEARELTARLPDVPHIQNPDRVAAATLAVEELDMQVIVLDDGFQHRRLHRDVDIVLIDALEPFGFGHVFPRGTLREPMLGLRRADVVALSRADCVSEQCRASLRDKVLTIAPNVKWIEVAHVPQELHGNNSSTSLRELSGMRVLAFCGLGNPAGFRTTLETCGAEIIDFHEFPDHHEYGRDDIAWLKQWIAKHTPEMIVCTHKDYVKLAIDRLANVPLRALIVELEVISGVNDLHDVLHDVIIDGKA